MSRTIRPERSPCCPDRPKAFVVSDRILDNESLHPFRVCQYHAKANRAAVVLRGDVIEGIREPIGVRPVTVSEAWVIRRDKMIMIGKSSEERLKHPRGRGKSVQ